jgi:hypothetical protein
LIPDQVRAGRGDERHESLQKLERLEHDVRRAIPPAMPQAVEQAPILEAFQPRGGDGRAPAVTAQPLETPAVAGGDGDVGVQREA